MELRLSPLKLHQRCWNSESYRTHSSVLDIGRCIQSFQSTVFAASFMCSNTWFTPSCEYISWYQTWLQNWECSIKKQLLHLEKVSIIFTSRSTSLGSVQCDRPYAERQAVRDTRNTANRHKHELMLVETSLKSWGTPNRLFFTIIVKWMIDEWEMYVCHTNQIGLLKTTNQIAPFKGESWVWRFHPHFRTTIFVFLPTEAGVLVLALLWHC